MKFMDFWKNRKASTSTSKVKVKEVETVMDVCVQWVSLINREIEGGWLSIDFGAVPVVIMKTEAYNVHICDGDFKVPDDDLAHAYFKALRIWMNYSRAYWNGANAKTEEERLGVLTDSDMVTFGVEDENGDVYLMGRENKETFIVEQNVGVKLGN